VPPLSALDSQGFGEFESRELRPGSLTFLEHLFLVQSGEALREPLQLSRTSACRPVAAPGSGAVRDGATTLGYLQGGGYRANPLEVMAYDLQIILRKTAINRS